MIIDDESSSTAKTSIKMTRAMSEDIGLKVKKILKEIIDETVNLSYDEWMWFISQCWCDDIWIMAMVKVINSSKENNINLNKNKFFLDLVVEKTPSELKTEFRKIHPIARLALMELVEKQPPKPEKPHQAKDLWE